MIRLRVNGEDRQVTAPTLAALAEAEGLGPAKGVAVALDGQVVPRARWADVALADGQRIEIVRVLQGG